jgi:hypothetical protein
VRYHDLRSTQEVESCDALEMFLWACGTQQTASQIRDKFERSLDTIYRKMAHLADDIYGFVQINICPKTPTYCKVHNKLMLYAPFFDGCIGALDGTHIPAHVDHESRLYYINRKRCPSYNVIGIVDMDMRFTYVGAGLDGSCHDMSVVRDCMVQLNYPIHREVWWHVMLALHTLSYILYSKCFCDFICLFIGRYYLVDADYAIRESYLPLYWNQRYHLEDFYRR